MSALACFKHASMVVLLIEGRQNIFLSACRSQFVAIGPANILKIGLWVTFLWPKLILTRDVALNNLFLNKFVFGKNVFLVVNRFSFFAAHLRTN